MISPTFRYHDRMTVIIDPPDLAGRIVVAIDALPCLEPFGGNAACGLVRNHLGECWVCSRELIVEGPFAVLKAGPTERTSL